MKNVHSEGTIKTPEIILDADFGVIELIGKSLPENASDIYDPILNWIDEYMQNPAETTTVNFRFEYLNSRSLKFILDILRKMKVLYQKEYKVTANWYVDPDDEDMIEIGEDFQSTVFVPLKITEVIDY